MEGKLGNSDFDNKKHVAAKRSFAQDAMDLNNNFIINHYNFSNSFGGFGGFGPSSKNLITPVDANTLANSSAGVKQTEVWIGNKEAKHQAIIWNQLERKGLNDVKGCKFMSSEELSKKKEFATEQKTNFFLRPVWGLIYGASVGTVLCPRFSCVMNVDDEVVKFGTNLFIDATVRYDFDQKSMTMDVLNGYADCKKDYLDMLEEAVNATKATRNMFWYAGVFFIGVGVVGLAAFVFNAVKGDRNRQRSASERTYSIWR